MVKEITKGKLEAWDGNITEIGFTVSVPFSHTIDYEMRTIEEDDEIREKCEVRAAEAIAKIFGDTFAPLCEALEVDETYTDLDDKENVVTYFLKTNLKKPT